jgi:hypothetical protein
VRSGSRVVEVTRERVHYATHLRDEAVFVDLGAIIVISSDMSAGMGNKYF